jgi:hypothetical protein
MYFPTELAQVSMHETIADTNLEALSRAAAHDLIDLMPIGSESALVLIARRPVMLQCYLCLSWHDTHRCLPSRGPILRLLPNDKRQISQPGNGKYLG